MCNESPEKSELARINSLECLDELNAFELFQLIAFHTAMDAFYPAKNPEREERMLKLVTEFSRKAPREQLDFTR